MNLIFTEPPFLFLPSRRKAVANRHIILDAAKRQSIQEDSRTGRLSSSTTRLSRRLALVVPTRCTGRSPTTGLRQAGISDCPPAEDPSELARPEPGLCQRLVPTLINLLRRIVNRRSFLINLAPGWN